MIGRLILSSRAFNACASARARADNVIYTWPYKAIFGTDSLPSRLRTREDLPGTLRAANAYRI